MNMNLLDMEPDEDQAPALTGEVMPSPPEDDAEPDDALAIAQVMPEDFPLQTLLRFMPDISLKRAVESAAAAVLAIDVTQPDGLTRLDAALPALRQAIVDSDAPFEDPVGWANQLHKRLTGLRGDFRKPGVDALETGNDRLRVEKRRREALDVEARRAAQAVADAQAKQSLAQAAKDAAARNAPKDVVAAMKREAKTAVAPPVYVPPSAPPLANTSVVDKWVCRLKGTPDDAEPNPDTGALSLAQQQQVRSIYRAIADGQVPLTAADLNWSYLNKRAGAEKTTFAMIELEAHNEGGTKQKPGSKRKK